jgi:hypothetical protein
MKKIIEITSIKQLKELSGAGGAGSSMAIGSVSGGAKEMSEEETLIREVIRRKLKRVLTEKRRHEEQLRFIIRQLIKEGDISDIHPHRSTAINILEDVLKKAIPTLRTDYKRMTTAKSQRESFRAHILKAVKDALAPHLVNWKYLSGQEGVGGLLSEPPTEDVKADAELDVDDDDLLSLEPSGDKTLDEVNVEIDMDDEEEPDETKKVPVEADDEPDEQEEFGSGLEEMDETGRNMAFTTFRKVSQYILDAFDTLADVKDKEVFVDYLITNLKLYFDKFEDELQNTVDEPTSPAYEQNK